jgi:phage tail-like protein
MSATVFPVSFYFLVTFQNSKGVIFQTSFSEVRGIGWKLQTKEDRLFGLKVKMPDQMTQNELVLVRPITALSDDFSDWVDKCSLKLAFRNGNDNMIGVKACDVVVKLMDHNGEPRASWSFYHAYPVDYSLGNLKASESGLAMETITLTYNFGWRVQ